VESIGGTSLFFGVFYMMQHAQWVTSYNEYGELPPVPTPVAICISIIFVLAGVAAALKYPWFSTVFFVSAVFASATHTVFDFSRWLIVYNKLIGAHYAFAGLLFFVSIVGLAVSIKARKRPKEST
jgi:hypothetical protein